MQDGRAEKHKIGSDNLYGYPSGEIPYAITDFVGEGNCSLYSFFCP